MVITAGKEEVLNERRRWVHLGRTLATGCSGELAVRVPGCTACTRQGRLPRFGLLTLPPPGAALPAEVLDSSQFDDFEEFVGAVQKLWDEQWARVHAAPRSGALPTRARVSARAAAGPLD